MPTKRRFAPPPNNILAGFTVTIVPFTIPWTNGNILQHIRGHHPAFDILAPSRSGDRHASLGSSDTTTSLGTDGDILQHIRANVPPSNGGEWRQWWKHHPTFDILAASRRAPTEQRCQRRTLVETSATTDHQGQPHPRGEQEARREGLS
jgi:hypothetical protein